MAKDWTNYTDNQLIDMAKELHQCIEVDEVFSNDEALEYHNICAVLYNRGYKIVEGLNIYKEA